MPPLRHTYLPHETLDLADSMAFDGHLRQAQADVSFHAALPEAVSSIWQASPRVQEADPFAPLPMPEAAPVVVSARPDAMRTREALQQGMPAPLQASGSPGTGITFGPAAAAPSDVTLGLPTPPSPGGTTTTPGSAPAASAAARPAGAAATGEPGDLRAWARSEAARLGIDPDVAEAVAMSEGGFDDPTRQSDVVYQGRRETSYGPFQLNTAGGLGSAAIAQGIDPRNPAHARAGVTFALEHAAREGWGAFHGAARVGIGPRQGIGVRPTAPSPAPAASSQPAAAQPGAAPPLGTYTRDNIQVNQLSQGLAEGLTREEALAVCGPAAALAFSRAVGRNPTLREAKELASRLGVWNVDQGMAGPASEVKLLDAMGINAELQQGADEATIIQEIQAGRPVVIDTPLHYYVAQDYDPATRTFDFGQSAAVLRASGGRTRFRLDELPSLGMGAARATILLRGAK